MVYKKTFCIRELKGLDFPGIIWSDRDGFNRIKTG